MLVAIVIIKTNALAYGHGQISYSSNDIIPIQIARPCKKANIYLQGYQQVLWYYFTMM